MLELNKIYQMDCLEGMKLLDDNSVDCVISDFPYNISNYGNSLTKKGDDLVRGDFGEWDKWDSMDEYINRVFDVVKLLKQKCVENANIILFFDNRQAGWFGYELERKKMLSYKSPLILVKNNPLPHIRKKGFRSSFEHAIWMVNKIREKDFDVVKGYYFNFLEQDEMMNVQAYNIGQKTTTHPTEKPLRIIKRFVTVFCKEGGVVLDCFMGSGTTAVACKETNRNFIGFETETSYMEMANKRLSQKVLDDFDKIKEINALMNDYEKR